MNAPCDAGLARLRLNLGWPKRRGRRVLPLDVRHRALLVVDRVGKRVNRAGAVPYGQ
jgi:hypothetical protein